MVGKKQIYKYIGLILAILLMAFVTVSVGVTYSRYQIVTTQSITFQVRIPATIQVGESSLQELASQVALMEVDDEGQTEGAENSAQTASAGVSGWTKLEDGTYQLVFYVNNQNGQGYYPHDIHFSLYLNTTLAAGLEGTEVSLLVKNANGVSREIVGERDPFPEHSQLIYQMGSGYQYRFYDMTGHDELVWTLSGDSLSEQQFCLQIKGLTDNCLIEVIAEETQSQK